MGRKWTVATVHFQAKTPERLHSKLAQGAQAAGVGWPDVLTIIDKHLKGACRTFAEVQLEEMGEWGPEEWQRAFSDFV